MEKEILATIKQTIETSVVSELTGYNKPLSKLISRVVDDHDADLYTLINNEFSLLLSSKAFKKGIKDALNKKLATTLISRMGGELEKRVNELRANPSSRAKITLAIETIVDNEINGR